MFREYLTDCPLEEENKTYHSKCFEKTSQIVHLRVKIKLITANASRKPLTREYVEIIKVFYLHIFQ